MFHAKSLYSFYSYTLPPNLHRGLHDNMAPHLDSTATHPGKKHAGETRSDKQSPRIFTAKRCVFPFGMQVQPLNLLNTVNIKKHSSEEWAVVNLSGISIIIVTGF